MLEELEIIEIKAKPTFVLFPRGAGKEINIDNPWACIKFNIESVVSGELESDEKCDVIVVGNYGFNPISEDKAFTIKFRKEFNKKRNAMQNTLLSISLDYDFKDKSEQQNFLKHIVTDKQMKALYDTLDDPFQCIIDGSIAELSKVKGIGETVAKRILKKYENNVAFKEFYMELPQIDLTQFQIKKLIEHFGGVKATVETIKENPYSLIDVSGYSFKKADAVALQIGISLTSVYRIKAFLETHLNLMSNEKGLNWLTGKELTKDIYNTLGNSDDLNEFFTEKEMKEYGYEEDNNIAEAVHRLIKEEVLVVDEDEETNEKRYYLNKVHNIEKEVAERLVKLIHTPVRPVEDGLEDRVKEIEKQNGWQFNEGQWNAIKKGCGNNVIVIHGGAGCVDCDTEFFNGFEWKSIRDFNIDDNVLQYSGTTKNCELVKPAAYIKMPCEVLTEFKSNQEDGIDICVSDDHWWLYDNGREFIKEQTKDILEKHKNSSGFRGRIPATFKSTKKGVKITSELVALIGGILHSDYFAFNPNNNICYIKFPKNSKELDFQIFTFGLASLQRDYEVKIIGDGKVFTFMVDDYIGRMIFDWTFFSEDNARQIIETFKNQYSSGNKLRNDNKLVSNNKSALDYLQGLYAICGIRTHITQKNKIISTMETEYTLVVDSIDRNYTLVDKTPKGYEKKVAPKPYKTKDGFQYCFSVPSGVLILRRNGKIFATGNCGKTASLTGLLGGLDVTQSEIAMCAFTGKAAARMQESSGYSASTIHKLLGIKGTEPEYNEDNKLPHKVIIMDEFSMTPLSLLRLLLRAMKEGSRLIFLGDSGQLQSISMGNLSTDLIKSPVVPSAGLTEIMRQAQESGIICLSSDVNKGQEVFKSSYEGETLVKQDTYIFSDRDSEFLFENIVNDFQSRWEAGRIENKQDFIILAPVKYRGKLCCSLLNNAIQDIVNPQSKLQEFLKEELKVEFKNNSKNEDEEDSRSFVLRVGDNVICNHNKYNIRTTEVERVPNVDGDGDGLQDIDVTTNIFNGWTGELIKLDKDQQIGYFKFYDCEYTVILDVNEIKECITLGYAISIHKSQGAEWKEVYIAIDNAGYSILTREMLYTAITRAKNRLLMYVNPSAFNRAIGKKDSTLKRTFLQELLLEEDKKYKEKITEIIF